MKALFQCMLVLLISVTSTAFAVRVNSIYKAELPVASQSVQDRNQAVQQGLEQVLIKVSGNSRVLENPAIKSHLTSADTLMQEFSYAAAPRTVNNLPYLLELQFDNEGINKLLRDAGVPIWGQNRPLIVAWVTFEEPNHPAEIVSSDTGNDVQAFLKQHANARGLPILLPMMDMTDLNQVTAHDVTAMALPTLQNAAKRYASDAILVGQLKQSGSGLVNSEWKFVMGTEQKNWEITGKNVSDVLSTVINNTADNLAARYSVVMSNAAQMQLTLKVSGVKQQDDLLRLMGYLQRLTSVTEVRLSHVSGDEVVLNVSLRGNKKSLVEVLAINKSLEPQATDPADDSLLAYRWTH